MKTSINQKLFLFSFMILACNGLLGYAVYESNQRLLDSEQWVQHTEQVIDRSANILSITKNMETAASGFLITRDRSFLPPLYNGQKKVFVYLRQLKGLTIDNPPQQKRIDSLNLYMRGYLAFLLKTVETRRKQKTGPAMAYIAAKRSKVFTDIILRIGTTIQQEENTLLLQRKKINGRSIKTFKQFSVGLFISIIGFTVFLLIMLAKYLHQNKEKENRAAELAVANIELLFQNGEKHKRAAELVIANTELLYQNDEKKKRADELTIAVNERAAMVNDLLLRNTDLEQFGYIISHNLRAPVANIIGAASALNDPNLSKDDIKILNSGISVSVKKLDNVIKDLNNILEVKGEISDIKEIVHFSTLTSDIEHSIKNLTDKYNIEIKCDFSVANKFLTIRAYLYSIFYNLISNSIKYRTQHGPCHIEIKSAILKNKLLLTFNDNGIGIDLKKNGSDVFGLYKRFHPQIEGKGMGLFMVKTQVETLGGKISVNSAENKGAEFKIEFKL